MRTLRNSIILVVLATLSLAMLSFHTNLFNLNLEESGQLIKKVYRLSDFNKVTVSNGIDLFLRPSDKNEVVIVSDKNVFETLSIKQKNGELQLGLNKRIRRTAQGTRVYLSYKSIDGIKALRNCSVNTTNGATLKAQSLSIIARYNSDIIMNLDVEKLSLQSSSNTSSILSGRADSASIKISTNSDLNAKRLTSSSMDIKASVNSNANVKALNTVKAHANINSDISIIGKPKKQYTTISLNSGITIE